MPDQQTVSHIIEVCEVKIAASRGRQSGQGPDEIKINKIILKIYELHNRHSDLK